MGRFGITEILILLAVALLLFGGSRIANIGKGLGEGIRNFKKGIKDGDEEPKLGEGEEKSAEKLPSAAATPASAEKLSTSEKS